MALARATFGAPRRRRTAARRRRSRPTRSLTLPSPPAKQNRPALNRRVTAARGRRGVHAKRRRPRPSVRACARALAEGDRRRGPWWAGSHWEMLAEGNRAEAPRQRRPPPFRAPKALYEAETAEGGRTSRSDQAPRGRPARRALAAGQRWGLGARRRAGRELADGSERPGPLIDGRRGDGSGRQYSQHGALRPGEASFLMLRGPPIAAEIRARRRSGA